MELSDERKTRIMRILLGRPDAPLNNSPENSPVGNFSLEADINELANNIPDVCSLLGLWAAHSRVSVFCFIFDVGPRCRRYIFNIMALMPSLKCYGINVVMSTPFWTDLLKWDSYFNRKKLLVGRRPVGTPDPTCSNLSGWCAYLS